MRLSTRKIFAASAPGIALQDNAARFSCGKRKRDKRLRAGPPFHFLALLCLCLLMAAPQNPVLAQDTTPLAAPTDLSASVSAEGVTLSWTAPAGLRWTVMKSCAAVPRKTRPN